MTEILVRRAISTIRDRYGEPLSLDDLAKAAMMSKFHFLRTFRSLTGTTPARFLCAVRLHEAKHLLFTTQLSVAETSVRVGYASLGTFTRRFTECVGLPPTVYRQVARGEVVHPDTRTNAPAPPGRHGTVTGTVATHTPPNSPIFVGLFATPTPQGRPIAHLEVGQPGDWQLSSVPAGSWYVLAAARTDRDVGAGPAAVDPTGRPLLTGMSGSVRLLPGAHARIEITLRAPDWSSPPLLPALVGLHPLPDGPTDGTISPTRPEPAVRSAHRSEPGDPHRSRYPGPPTAGRATSTRRPAAAA